MLRVLWKGAYWCVAVALAFMGVRDGITASSHVRWEVGVSWLHLFALPVAFLGGALVMATIAATKWFLDRQHAQDIQHRIRTNLTVGAFRETDAADALAYLLRESAWGWRLFAHVNHWEIADGLQFSEFEQAAERGDIITVGWSGVAGKPVVIERRYWKDGRIRRSTASIHGGVEMHMPRFMGGQTFSMLAVADADLRQVWPPAPAWLKICAVCWVWTKRAYYRVRHFRLLPRR